MPESSVPETGDAAAAQAGATGPGLDSAVSGDGQVTVVPGIARYHRTGCILIRFLGPEDLETMSRQAAESSDFVPCKACKPDQDIAESDAG